jgi:hypothetical protein
MWRAAFVEREAHDIKDDEEAAEDTDLKRKLRVQKATALRELVRIEAINKLKKLTKRGIL